MKAIKLERGLYRVGHLVVRRVEPRKLPENRHRHGLVAQYWQEEDTRAPIAYTLKEVKEIAKARSNLLIRGSRMAMGLPV